MTFLGSNGKTCVFLEEEEGVGIRCSPFQILTVPFVLRLEEKKASECFVLGHCWRLVFSTAEKEVVNLVITI